MEDIFKCYSGKGKQRDRRHCYTLNLSYLRMINNSIRHELMDSRGTKIVWSNQDEGRDKSFVGYLQVFYDEAKKSLEGTAMEV